MKAKFYILLVLIGFLLMPINAFACGNKSQKSCCPTELKSAKCKMACCQKKSKDKSSKGCEGKCNKSTCQIQTVTFGAIMPELTDITSNNFLVLTSKQAFYNSKTDIKSGFYFIWSPPNIG